MYPIKSVAAHISVFAIVCMAAQVCVAQGYIVRFGQCSVFLIPINKRQPLEISVVFSRWGRFQSVTEPPLWKYRGINKNTQCHGSGVTEQVAWLRQVCVIWNVACNCQRWVVAQRFRYCDRLRYYTRFIDCARLRDFKILPIPKEYISLGLFPNSATSDDVILLPKLEVSDLLNLKKTMSTNHFLNKVYYS
jgi:hypothetical protein